MSIQNTTEYKCIIWGTELYSGEGVRQELLDAVAMNDRSASPIYEKYKEKGCENTFFLKYSIECGESPYIWRIKDNQFEVYNSQAGGLYRADYPCFLSKLYNNYFSNEVKIRLSGWIAKENLNGRIPDLAEVIKGENWLKNLPPVPDDPTIKAGLLLKGLANVYPAGKFIFLNINTVSHHKNNPAPFLYALSYCSDSEEFQYLLYDFLEKELECITVESTFPGGNVAVRITPKGWKRVNKVENKTVKENSKTAFIAMWFNPSMNNLKEEIKKGIRQSGYEPLRIDEKEYNNKIDDEILSDIDQSRFVICDLTSEPGKPRGSVYFEAGYATKGRGKEFIIWTCDEQLKNEIAFDVGRYNFIFWSKDENGDFWVQDGSEKVLLKDKIQKRINSVLYRSGLNNSGSYRGENTEKLKPNQYI